MEPRRTPLLLTALLAVLCTSATVLANSLDSKLNALLGSNLVKGASVGVSVVEVKPGRADVDLYEHNATMPLGPASNCKLLTTSAAFERYGPKANFKTMLYKVGDDLVIVGGGDPALGDAKLLGSEKVTTPFLEWAEQLKKQGITSYRDLIVDDRVFDNQWAHPNWPADQRLNWYSAPIGGLNFNDNCLDWIPKVSQSGVGAELIPDTTYVDVDIKAKAGKQMLVTMFRPAESNHFVLRGTVAGSRNSANVEPYSTPIFDPGIWTGTILRDTFSAAGIKSTGAIRRVGMNEKIGAGMVVAEHATSILAVLARANKNSVNMMAECLCKRLGHDATGEPGSWSNGPAAVMAYLKKIGVETDGLKLDDGSGLSSKNRVSARAFTTVLAHIANRPDADDYVNTLAEAGEEGTLKRRFRNMSVAPHVHAKTGHINGVSTLSGFIDVGEGKAKRRIVFSILCNKYQGNVNPWQDQVCQAIYDWAK